MLPDKDKRIIAIHLSIPILSATLTEYCFLIMVFKSEYTVFGMPVIPSQKIL